jgi:phosphinothricin acetyltransferase
MIEIEEAKESHLEGILEILNHEIATGTSVYDYDKKSSADIQDWFELKKKEDFPIFVAIENGIVISYASYGFFRPRKGYQISVEHSIYTHPEHRGKGTGKLLMRHLIDSVQKRGFEHMIAVIDGSNHKSIRFHKKFGFIEAGRLERVAFKFGKHLDAVFMQRTL